jgi:hypothetical protein
MATGPACEMRGIESRLTGYEPSAARIAVADLAGDGRLDLATRGYYAPAYFRGEDPQLVLFLNRYGTPISGAPVSPAPPLGG